MMEINEHDYATLEFIQRFSDADGNQLGKLKISIQNNWGYTANFSSSHRISEDGELYYLKARSEYDNGWANFGMTDEQMQELFVAWLILRQKEIDLDRTHLKPLSSSFPFNFE